MKEIAVTIKIENETPRTIIIKAESKEDAESFFLALLQKTNKKFLSVKELQE